MKQIYLLIVFLFLSLNTLGAEIYIRLVTGEVITLDVELMNTVLSVKEQIKESNGIPVEDQALIFAGKNLNNYLRLIDYNVQNESTFSLVDPSVFNEPLTGLLDINFEQALIDLSIDTVGELDGFINTEDISGINSLNIANKNISDLTGIEDFTALEFLEVNDNNLTTVDLSNNTMLNNLSIYNNSLEALDLSANTLLFRINCNNNKIAGLYLSTNAELRDLSCQSNQLTSLNVKNGNNHNITFFAVLIGNNLSCIQVDDTDSDNTWATAAQITLFSEDCKYNLTNIPDDNFEQALIDLGSDNVLDGKVSTSNIENLTSLDISDKNISNLTGIENFTALTELRVNNNNLSSIDLSKNYNLQALYCDKNRITNLDLSSNSKLKIVGCNDNLIESLNVSSNPDIIILWCYNNKLTSLDVSSITDLKTFSAYGNGIETLDVSKNTKLEVFNCVNNSLTILNVANGNNSILKNFNATNNSKLTCIQIDDINNIGSAWIKDASASYSEICITSYVPDDNFEQALIDLGYDDTLDDYVITTNISGITSLNIANKNISDLTGIEDFIALEFLKVNDNNLTTVDLSSNTKLNNLSIYNNSLESLDLSANTLLFRINCDNNKIASLDLSTNAELRDLSCQSNQLTSLNVKNGNNHNITFFAVLFGNNLSCIQVDNIDSDNTWASEALIALFSENCNATAGIVDSVFNNSVVVYPNPVKNTLSINIKNNQELESVQVFNLLGKKVIEQQSKNIDFNSLTPGMYILKIISKEGKIAIKKVIKQ